MQKKILFAVMEARISNWEHFVCWGASSQPVSGGVAEVTQVCITELEESNSISKNLAT